MSYYYLIASLPGLSLNKKAQKIDYEDILDTIQRNLEPSDARQFRYLLYPNDHQNLLHVLFEKHKAIPQTPKVYPAIFSEKELADYHKNRMMFPAYMSYFLDEYTDQFPTLTMKETEELLWELFYEEVEHQDPFIVAYYQFERKLKMFFSAYNYSNFDFLTVPNAEEGILNQIGKGLSIPPDWLRNHPHIEDIGEAISSKEPGKIEKLMNQMKWDYLDEKKGVFNKEQVFEYTLKLLMVQRWQNLLPERGASRFVEMQERIKHNVRSLQNIR
ncbi:MAG: DUF2764 family protein [Marinoscillum sp.]|uniref:DUF2764 family protein n=1 Tax=Marinoscillum sp. TaxID=2024838 RepID=UPI0032F1A758